MIGLDLSLGRDKRSTVTDRGMTSSAQPDRINMNDRHVSLIGLNIEAWPWDPHPTIRVWLVRPMYLPLHTGSTIRAVNKKKAGMHTTWLATLPPISKFT